MAVKLNWMDRGVIYLMSGTVTQDEVFDVDEAFQSDSRYDEVRFVIIDALDVTQFEISLDELMQVAAIDKSSSVKNPFIRMAFVCIDREVCMHFENYMNESYRLGSKWKFCIFETFERAKEWSEAIG